MKAIAFLVAATLVLAGCGSDNGDGGSSQTKVGTADNAELGQTVLVDSNGMTLYELSAEKDGRFICTDASCLSLWHPVVADGAKPEGVDSLATVKRPDGDQQVTYNGHPLYTFANDSKKGDAKGEGFKDVGVWHAATVSGEPASPDSGGGGGGYGGY